MSDFIIVEVDGVESDGSGRIKSLVTLDGVTINVGRVPTLADINGVAIDSQRLKVLAGLDQSVENRVRIEDGDGNGYQVGVTPSGEMRVVTPTPATPEGKTPVLESYRGTVSGSDLKTYIIPSGETLTIQYFETGAEKSDTASSRVTLYYAPNGSLDGNEEILTQAYVDGTNFASLPDVDIVGDGTKAIILERLRLGGGSAQIYGKWQGYF